MKNIIISDVTLRDGNHAVRHQINKNIINIYSKFAEKNKIDILEVGHGNGLGASSLTIGKSKVSNIDAIKYAKRNLKKTKLSVHSIPGFSTLDDVKAAIDHGADLIRVGCNSSDIDIIERQFLYCKKNKIDSWCVFMMFHQIYSNNKYISIIKDLKKLGIKTFIVMDSAGILLPEDIKKIFTNLKKLKVRSGFHGHNNLGCATANTLEAIKHGAVIIDCAIRGFGAGAGNTQLEMMIALLKKLKNSNKFNVREVYKMSDKFIEILEKNKIFYKDIFTHPISISTGLNGLFSGFSPKIKLFAQKYNVNSFDISDLAGEKQLVAGQDDLLMNIAHNLSIKGKK
jgi:4-hydroxy 2-oxovalerate aldolase